MIIATILTTLYSISYELVKLTEPTVHYAIAPAVIAAIGLAAQLGGSKLNFIMNSQKYVFKEKGRETEENAAETNNKLDELDKKLIALNKLMNL